MAWAGKTKNTADTPTLKTRNVTRVVRGRILTPDGNQVLVGSSEDLILIYQDDGTLWGNFKQKNAVGSWSAKTKTPVV